MIIFLGDLTFKQKRAVLFIRVSAGEAAAILKCNPIILPKRMGAGLTCPFPLMGLLPSIFNFCCSDERAKYKNDITCNFKSTR